MLGGGDVPGGRKVGLCDFCFSNLKFILRNYIKLQTKSYENRFIYRFSFGPIF